MRRRSVNARTLTTKRAAAREFARHGSGYILVAYLAAALVLRRRRGRPARADATVVAAVAAIQPFFEWTLHRYVLHAPPTSIAGRPFDPGAAHRGHHRAPDDVAGALLGARYAAADGLVVAGLAAALGRLVAGPAGTITGAAAGQGALLAYEWTHLLAHTGYRPRTRWFRRLRAAHLRHHFRDERANFGVTSRLGDRILGTAA
ncbi:MAG: sterol desaturase family protein [Acidimicrobiales bacterium]|nr:sterol desaturase family protein [Acidimicrobiales bacterium]